MIILARIALLIAAVIVILFIGWCIKGIIETINLSPQSWRSQRRRHQETRTLPLSKGQRWVCDHQDRGYLIGDQVGPDIFWVSSIPQASLRFQLTDPQIREVIDQNLLYLKDAS